MILFLLQMELLQVKRYQQVKEIARNTNLSWKIWYLVHSSWLIAKHREWYQVPIHITHVGCLEPLISTSIHLILLEISLLHESIHFRMILSLPICDVAFHYWVLNYIEDFLDRIHMRRILRQCDCCYISAFQVTSHLICKMNLCIIKYIDHLLLVFSPIVSLQLLKLLFQSHQV